jgi:hypothetical protein
MPPKRTTTTRTSKRLKRTNGMLLTANYFYFVEEKTSVETLPPIDVNEAYLEISIPDPTIQTTEGQKELSLNDGKRKQTSDSKEEKTSKRKYLLILMY